MYSLGGIIELQLFALQQEMVVSARLSLPRSTENVKSPSDGHLSVPAHPLSITGIEVSDKMPKENQSAVC